MFSIKNAKIDGTSSLEENDWYFLPLCRAVKIYAACVKHGWTIKIFIKIIASDWWLHVCMRSGSWQMGHYYDTHF